jgi:DNA adenine methylase
MRAEMAKTATIEQAASDYAQPLLKWPGGKRALAHVILPVIGKVTGTYFEPFFGGGAIFFALGPRMARLSDLNPELMECYQSIKEDPDGVAKHLSRLKNDETMYYKVRQSRPRSALGRSARLIYLTSLSFNGIYRQNLKGEFNVPYGYKYSKSLPTIEQLRHVSRRLSSAALASVDFQEATAAAAPGDTVYFDPPYTVAHNNNGFVKYNASIFSWDDQRRLAEHATWLANRGCRVFISNADHDAVRKLYQDFECLAVERRSVIAASSSKRRSITECFFHTANR